MERCVLINGRNEESLEIASGFTLCIADPPWSYRNAGCRGTASGRYRTQSFGDIIDTLNAAYDIAAPDSYLLLWCTYPKIVEWARASADLKWRHLTGGSWHKSTGMGVGFHVRGDSEPWLLYAKGNPKPRHKSFRNAFASPRKRHSEKPESFLRLAIECFSDPDDLILSLWSGLFPEGRAALSEGRRVVGAELDPDRFAISTSALYALE